MSPSQSPSSKKGWTNSTDQVSAKVSIPRRAGLGVVAAPTRQSQTPIPSVPSSHGAPQSLSKPRAPSAGGQPRTVPHPGGDTRSSVTGPRPADCPRGRSSGPYPRYRALPAVPSSAGGTGSCRRYRALRCRCLPTGAAARRHRSGADGAGAAHGARFISAFYIRGLYPRFISVVYIRGLYTRFISAVHSAATAPPAARRDGGSPGAPHRIILLRTAPHRSALLRIILHRIIPLRTAPHHSAPHRIILHSTTSLCSAPFRSSPHHSALLRTAPHRIASHRSAPRHSAGRCRSPALPSAHGARRSGVKRRRRGRVRAAGAEPPLSLQ